MERILREAGRPKLTYRFHVRLTEEEGKRIGQLAERYGRKRTDIVRGLIRLGLEAHERG